jgi:hypothetical protein
VVVIVFGDKVPYFYWDGSRLVSSNKELNTFVSKDGDDKYFRYCACVVAHPFPKIIYGANLKAFLVSKKIYLDNDDHVFYSTSLNDIILRITKHLQDNGYRVISEDLKKYL